MVIIKVRCWLQIDALWSQERLLGRTMEELKQCAALNGCTGYSRMNKADLVTLLGRRQTESLRERGVNNDAVVKESKFTVLVDALSFALV